MLPQIRKYLAIATVVSVAANGILIFALRAAVAKQDTIAQTCIAEAEQSANQRWEATLEAERKAQNARVTELLRRQKLSDQVTRDAQERAADATAALQEFKAGIAGADPTWLSEHVPPEVLEQLRAL